MSTSLESRDPPVRKMARILGQKRRSREGHGARQIIPDTNTTPTTRDRGLRIMNELVNGLEARGFIVEVTENCERSTGETVSRTGQTTIVTEDNLAERHGDYGVINTPRSTWAAPSLCPRGPGRSGRDLGGRREETQLQLYRSS